MSIEILFIVLIVTILLCVWAMSYVINESNKQVRLEEWQAYRKQAMNGLIFEDRWEPRPALEYYANGVLVSPGKQPTPPKMLEYKPQPIDLVEEVTIIEDSEADGWEPLPMFN